MRTYNIFQNIQNDSNLLDLLQEIDEYKTASVTIIHPIYFSQITQLTELIQYKLQHFEIRNSYFVKDLTANVRDLAVLLKSQQFKLKKQITYTETNQFNLCHYFQQILSNSICYTFVFSTLNILSNIWQLKIAEKVESNCNSQFLNPDRNEPLLKEYKDYLDYILLFFRHFKYGTRNLYDDLLQIRILHKNQWPKDSEIQKEDSSIEKNTNFIFSCLIPFLDNQGLVSIKYNKYELLLRPIRCLFAITGHLNRFYEQISKYQLQFLDDQESKIKIKNKTFLKNLIFNSEPHERTNIFITKSVLNDLCHFYGYDNIWSGSKLFGHLLHFLITEDTPDVCLSNNVYKVKIEINMNSDIVPNSIRQSVTSLNMLSLVISSNDLYGILQYLYYSVTMSDSCTEKTLIDEWIICFWKTLFSTQKDMYLKESLSGNLRRQHHLNSLFEAGSATVQQLLYSFHNELFKSHSAELSFLKISETDLTNSTVISFIIYPYKYRIKRNCVANKHTFILILLLGATICALQEGLVAYQVEKMVRNIPSINTVTHWIDKKIYVDFDQKSKETNGSLQTQGIKIMTQILALHIHEEWTPIIIGLLHALSKLVYGHKSVNEQWNRFHQYVAMVYKDESSEKSESESTKELLDNIIRKRLICSKPAKHLFYIQWLYMINGQNHYFTPMLRSTSLFYGGVVMFNKAKKCTFSSLSHMETEPSKNENDGYKQLLKCFEYANKNLNLIKDRCTAFLGHELFTKYNYVTIIDQWDFLYPFLCYIKQPERYYNIINDCYIKWMK
jgi:hypothetical protein